jgi:sugar transferase (PEP-CTERM system associated)
MLHFFKKYYPIRNVFFVIGADAFIYDHYILLKILLITSVCQACLYYNDLYDLTISDSYNEISLRLLQALGIAAILLAFIYLIVPQAIIGTGIFVASLGFVILLIVSWRFCYTLILNRGLFNQRIILLGSADLVEEIRHEIRSRKDCGYTITAEIPESNRNSDLNKSNNPTAFCGQKYEGLSEQARLRGVEKIVVAIKEKRNHFPTNELLKCRVAGIDIIEGNSFYEMLTGKLVVKAINPGWLIFSEGFRKSLTLRFLKRSVDLILAIIGLIIFLPLMGLIAILIKLDSRGPVIFSQQRVGQNRIPYQIHKFRSMISDAEKECGPVWAEDNDYRITRVGTIIRKWRFDEIPQLWNVLKGNMSFVGPRPERECFVKELEELIPYYRERHTVKPGITGWAQVSYGYGASVEDAIEKLNYDLFYIKNMSFFMDLMIVLRTIKMRTIKIVLFRKGAR